MAIYLLALIVAVEFSGCVSTQPVVSEPSANTIQQNNNEPERETSPAQENQAKTAPEENTTESNSAPATVDTTDQILGFAVQVLLLFLYVLVISGGGMCGC